MKKLNIALVSIGRVNFDMALAEAVTEKFRSQLIMNGLRIVAQEGILTDVAAASEAVERLRGQEFDLMLVFQATFADSSILMTLADNLDYPLFIYLDDSSG